MAESKHIEELNDGNFKEKIGSGVTLVDFYATWCGPCRMIAPLLEQLVGMVDGKARIAKLDIDQAQNVTNTLGITSVPTLILFKDGKEVKRVVGVKDLNFLHQLVTANV